MVPKNATKTCRLSGDERRDAIVEAVKAIFAEKGFHGTTTRELAKAAGVSEALLYKHFPSKELLYDAMLEQCASEAQVAEFERIVGLEPSTSTLVHLVHFLVSLFVGPRNAESMVMDRLMAHSFLEDRDYARRVFQKKADVWVNKFEQCLKAAAKAGDVHDVPARRDLAGWFAHHVAFAIKVIDPHSEPPVVDYKVSNDVLIEQAVWFALLGAGLKHEVIKRYYNPKAFALLGG